MKISIQLVDVNEDDPYEMGWCKCRWSLWKGFVNMMIPMKWVDVNEDDPYAMVWCKWSGSLWNGLI